MEKRVCDGENCLDCPHRKPKTQKLSRFHHDQYDWGIMGAAMHKMLEKPETKPAD